MASSDDPSPTSSPRSHKKTLTGVSLSRSSLESPVEDGFWSSLAKRAKSVLLDDGGVPFQSSWDRESKDHTKLQERSSSNKQENLSSVEDLRRQDSLVLHKGLEAIASSLSLLSDTLGSAIEDGLNLVEAKASDLIFLENQRTSVKKVPDGTSPEKIYASPVEKSGLTRETQLKASRDVAMAMATKAKLLLRELKGVKADLAFTRNRSIQLEEENKRLRESIDKGVRQEEDELVRLQLETLLAEKARLAQENSYYARENQFLHEVVQYHQLTLQDVVLLDDCLMDAELAGDAQDDMEFVPDCPHEKDILALEESVNKAN